MYCAGCAVTPYCSERCQRRDWADRHRAVCHNLARLDSRESEKRSEPERRSEPEPIVTPAAAPLRRPNNFKRDQPPPHEEKQTVPKFIPPGEKAQAVQAMSKAKNSPVRNNRSFGNNQHMQKAQVDKNEDDEWNVKPQSPIPSKPKPEPTPAQVPPTSMKTADLLSFVNAKQKSGTEKTKEVKEVQVKKSPVKLEPANYLVEELGIGEAFLASVETPTSECATKQPGFVCLTMHANFEETYNKLCIDYTFDCDKETGTVSPSPGELVSFPSAEEGGWWRARLLPHSRAALLDAAKLADVTLDQCKPMLQQYRNFPEFSAVIQAPSIKKGDNLKCTLKSKTGSGFKVSIVDAESGADLGEGQVSRWIPEVEVPAPVPPAATSASIPSVPRPPVKDGDRVVLLDVTSLHRAALRPHSSTEAFDAILHDVVLYGTKAIPLKEPPSPGQVVVAMYTDGLFYRALVKRTKSAQNKYLIEYIEYGNEEIAPLERMYPCPANLDISKLPPLATVVQLSTKETSTLTPPATAYVDKLKDNNEELILTIPSGEKTAPSGSLVNLTLAKNNESVNKKLELMCTPDWKKLEERGGDVLETKPLMYSDLKNAELPTDREFTLEIVDFDTLKSGSVFGYMKGDPLADAIYGPLTEKMNKYCESDLCKEPYLPRPEELCITKYPPYPQWFRAVLIEQVQGAGGLEARVLYIDYGNVGTVPVKDLRKMLPEFVEGYPALSNQVDIENFPENPSEAQLCLALEMMNITEEGRGSLLVKKCTMEDQSSYKIQVPTLIGALKCLAKQ